MLKKRQKILLMILSTNLSTVSWLAFMYFLWMLSEPNLVGIIFSLLGIVFCDTLSVVLWMEGDWKDSKRILK